jgi:hypothetical protein
VKDISQTTDRGARRVEARDAAIDQARAAAVLPVLARILGVERP